VESPQYEAVVRDISVDGGLSYSMMMEQQCGAQWRDSLL